MKKVTFLLFLGTLLFSCTQTTPPKEDSENADFSNKLTAEEIAGGRMTPEILWKFSRLGGIRLSPDKTTILTTITKFDYKTNKSKTNLYYLPVKGGEMSLVTDMSAFHPRWSPDGEKIGFLSDKSGSVQIWELPVKGNDPVKVTEIEGGINGFEYSPDGGMIYYIKDVKMDPTPQEIYPDLPKSSVRIIDDLMYRHWNHWQDYAYSHIFIAEYGEGKLGDAKDILEGEAFDTPLSAYFDDSEISWSNDGNYIAYTCKKLKGADYAVSTNSDIYLYNVKDGSTLNITKDNPGYDKYPVFSPDSKTIAYESMETPGYEADKNRLFIYHIPTGEREYLTPDFDQDVSSISWGENGNDLFFISGIKASFQLYKMDMKSHNIKQITAGDHNYTQFALEGKSLVGVKMTMSMASEVFRVNKETGDETQLSFINKSVYDNIEMGKVEKRWIKTTDNKDMLVWVIYPPGFDPEKKYPA
ncbi:MAG: PD40 domain-containing protein, partial [Bacteroidales bacterium]|nr:PD40 domain-containing protein [Bacteroidales bacterium]